MSPDERKSKSLLSMVPWLAGALVVLAIAGILLAHPLEAMALNYLYHLGQQKKWLESYQRLPRIPQAYRHNPRFVRIQLETFLHLARNSEAYALIQSQEALMAKHGTESARFRRLAAIGLILASREDRAAEILKSLASDPFCATLKDLLARIERREPADPRGMPALLNQAAKRYTYPDLPQAVVKYLFARSLMQQHDLARAVELLEAISAKYPREYVFRRTLAEAYLEAGRLDLANIQMRIARMQLHDPVLYPYSEGEARQFESAMLRQAYRYAASRVSADFWRVLRCMSASFSGAPAGEEYLVNNHPHSLPETWERVQYQKAQGGQKEEPIASHTLSARENALLAGIEQALQSKNDLLIPVPHAKADGAASATLIHAHWISNREVGLVETGQSASFRVPPPPPGYMEEGMLLCQVRGTLRQGIPGGCEMRLGQDKYFLPLDEQPQWYAFPLPMLAREPVELVFRFNSDSVPGYTGPNDKGDRNLYIAGILSCRIERR